MRNTDSTGDKPARRQATRWKVSVDELLRLACVWAEQDRRSLADAWHYDQTPEGVKALQQAETLKVYRLKKWGKTVADTLDGFPSVKIDLSPDVQNTKAHDEKT